MSFSNMNNTSEPKIQAGSVVEIAGSLYRFDSEESATGWGGISNSTQAYMRLVPSGSSVSAEWTTTAPTYRDDLQGWYDSGTNKRYALKCYKDSSGNYSQKIYITNVVYTEINIPVYSIGDTGPAGGLVFYDKGSYSDGWRYLEAAPASTEVNNVQWMSGSDDFDTGATATGIGDGYTNTIEVLSHSSGTADYYPSAFMAARAVAYGGYGDWFLPSKDELNKMYENLYNVGLGGFASDSYWTSSEVDSDHAWRRYFADGTQVSAYKSYSAYVRACRAF
jgi:hypothetical protein